MNTFILAAGYDEAQRVANRRGLHGNEWSWLTPSTADAILDTSHPTVLITDCASTTTMMSSLLHAVHARVEYIQCP